MGFAEASAGDEGDHQVYAKEVADKKVIEVLFMKVRTTCEQEGLTGTTCEGSICL